MLLLQSVGVAVVVVAVLFLVPLLPQLLWLITARAVLLNVSEEAVVVVAVVAVAAALAVVWALCPLAGGMMVTSHRRHGRRALLSKRLWGPRPGLG